MDEELVEIYAAGTATDAHQLRNLLLEAGIDAVVTNDALEGAIGGNMLGWPMLARVAVAREHAQVARQIALEFDRRIAARLDAPSEDSVEVEPSPVAVESWPRCPECDARRTTRCPICKATGTDFAQADPDYAGSPVVEKDAEPMSCGCGSGGCSPRQSVSDAEEAASGAQEGETSEPAQAAAGSPRLMLICPTCDEPFAPEYARRCRRCGHQFPDGREIAPEVRDRISPQGIALLLGLLVLLIALVVYFAMLF